MDVRKIRIENFDYPLPEERIAQHPLAERDSCKLLVAKPGGKITHQVFSILPLLLKPDTLIIANETKVIRARMEFLKESGARIEIFLLEPLSPQDYVVNFASTASCSWLCLIGNRKRWKEGPLFKTVKIKNSDEETRLAVELIGEREGNGYEVKFSWDNPKVSFAELVETVGNIPIPPYLKRKSEESDTSDYQTVYSKTEGSVAAPTAGLHFTPGLIRELKQRGNEFATVTLHVGAGTFQPVKSEEIGEHPMHTEWISVSRSTLLRLISALENGRDILAVGTTSVRTLESLPYLGALVLENSTELRVGQWMPYEKKYRDINTLSALKALSAYLAEHQLETLEATTSIMIAPGFRWRIVNRLITNFHQPKSTLLLLVSSFLGEDENGREEWRKVYEEALAKDYRFLSYGDACLFSRGPRPVELPLSKSMVLRAATIKAIENPTHIDSSFGHGICDDTTYYIKALHDVRESVQLPDGELQTIHIGEGAAPLRFLTAYAASLPGTKVRITCAPGLQKRPLVPLTEALRSIGADIVFSNKESDWQLIIRGKKLKGGEVSVDTTFTSQFVSALLLVSSLWEEPLILPDNSRLRVSKPYVRMTEEMMAYPDREPEPDWSAAAFFYEHVFIAGKGRLDISALTPPGESLQGDAVVCDLFGSLGVNTVFHQDGRATLRFDSNAFGLLKLAGRFEFDFTDYPDLVPAVVVGLCYRQIPFRLYGIEHLKYKESNRPEALCRILMRLGYGVGMADNTLTFDGDFKPMEEFPATIDPMGDHRLAMAFYPLELRGMVTIENKGVVSKSFPDFYLQFQNPGI